MGLPRLQGLCDIQMTPEQKSCLKWLADRQAVVPVRGDGLAEEPVSWAEEHLIERNSVVNEHELWRQALQYAQGQDMDFNDVLVLIKFSLRLFFGERLKKLFSPALATNQGSDIVMRDLVNPDPKRFGSGQILQSSKDGQPNLLQGISRVVLVSSESHQIIEKWTFIKIHERTKR
jgi:hypothetical protein